MWQDRPAIDLYSSDILMDIARVLLSLTVLITYCCRFITIKQLVFEMFKKDINSKIKNFSFTITFMLIPPIIAFIYPAAGDWISLLGAVCMTSLLITIPSLMAIKNWRLTGNNKGKICMTIVWAGFFTLMGYMAGLFVVLKMTGVTN